MKADPTNTATSMPRVTICDLDGTLIKTDLLLESTLRLVKSNPLLVFALPLWFLRGRAYAKAQIAKRVPLDPLTLPYRESVLALLNLRRAAGNRVILASAANEAFVQSIARHCACFDLVSGSTENVNLKATNKLHWIRTNVTEPFEYIGDSSADLAIWEKSAHAVLINPKNLIRNRIRHLGIPHEVIFDREPKLKSIIQQLRVHQWVKNLLIAVPAAAAHQLIATPTIQQTLTGIFSFSLLASLIYVMNDLLDVEHDRRHPRKRHRPFAAGRLSTRDGIALMLVLAIGSLVLGAQLGRTFVTIMVTYAMVNLAYSTRLKEVIMLDVVILASFYTMRLLAGSAATNVPVSHWLLSFSTFFFVSLAMIKRYTEMSRMLGDKQSSLFGRGYERDDKVPVLVMGISAAMVSILILAFYFSGPDVLRLYQDPTRLWALAPLLLYWNGRIWLLAHRGQIHDDPVVFAVKDLTSWVVFGIATTLVIASR